MNPWSFCEIKEKIQIPELQRAIIQKNIYISNIHQLLTCHPLSAAKFQAPSCNSFRDILIWNYQNPNLQRAIIRKKIFFTRYSTYHPLSTDKLSRFYGILILFCGPNGQDIEKRFSVPLKGVKKWSVSHQNLSFKIFAFSISQIFFRNFQKIMSYHFYWCLTSTISMVHSDILIFWQCYMHFSEGTPNHISLVYKKLKWQKSSFKGSSQICIKFSICKSSILIKFCEIGFQEFSNFSESIGRILLTPVAFLEVVDMDQLPILSDLEIILNCPWTQKIFLFLKVLHSVLNKGKTHLLTLNLCLLSIL